MSPLGVFPLCLLALLLSPSCLAKKTPPSPAAAPPIDYETLENVCELLDMEKYMYCYCNFVERGEGETANCWVQNITRASDRVWDTFYHQPGLHRLTIRIPGNMGDLDAVPTRALTYLHHLWTLELKNVGISTVHADAFAQSSSISDLALSRNGIEELERRSFNQLTNVTRLNLGENKLQVVNRQVFVNMPRLRHLYLDRNRISRIRSGAFVQLEGLHELELYGNALRTVTRGTFKGLSQLRRLDLHRNELEVIGDRTFAELPELTELDLAENRIQFLGGHGLEGLPNLVRLILRDNRLTQLQPATFRHTPNVYFLSLQQNRLQSLEQITFRPIMDNMNNITMYFYSAENRLRCDCRLAWLIRLRSRTASAHVKASLESTMCVMERGAVPARLGGPGTEDSLATVPEDGDGQQSRTQPAELPVKLLDLKISELPCDRPLAEEPVTEETPRPVPQLQGGPQHEPALQHQKTSHALSSAPHPARSSLTTRAPPPPPPSAGEVKLGGEGGGVGGDDSGNSASAVAAHGSLLLLVAAAIAAR